MMTRAGVSVSGREVAAITAAGTILMMGFWLGVGLTELRSEVRGLRQDICHYSVPEEARRFANSCQNVPSSGLAAQSHQ